MTTRQIKRAVDGVVIEKLDSGRVSASIPWLGVFWTAETMSAPVFRLEFLINPTGDHVSSPTRGASRYRGTLAGNISLRAAQSLTRQTLVANFGEPENTFDIRPNATNDIPESFQRMKACGLAGQSMATLTSQDTDVIYYPRHGLDVALHSNIVYTLRVWKKVEPTNAPYSSPVAGSKR
jgi:hypothetical protein